MLFTPALRAIYATRSYLAPATGRQRRFSRAFERYYVADTQELRARRADAAFRRALCRYYYAITRAAILPLMPPCYALMLSPLMLPPANADMPPRYTPCYCCRCFTLHAADATFSLLFAATLLFRLMLLRCHTPFAMLFALRCCFRHFRHTRFFATLIS